MPIGALKPPVVTLDTTEWAMISLLAELPVMVCLNSTLQAFSFPCKRLYSKVPGALLGNSPGIAMEVDIDGATDEAAKAAGAGKEGAEKAGGADEDGAMPLGAEASDSSLFCKIKIHSSILILGSETSSDVTIDSFDSLGRLKPKRKLRIDNETFLSAEKMKAQIADYSRTHKKRPDFAPPSKKEMRLW